MANSLDKKEAIFITPSEPTPSRVLSLSALDSQLFLRFTIEYLFVYRAQPGSDPRATVVRIKKALAKALVAYYPLAGRVRFKPDGSSLEVVCRGQGALFIEATLLDHTTIADFDKAPKHVTQWRKLLSFHVADVLKGAPPLIVQLTWLRDGTATLGIGFNHCLCDGIGSSQFLSLFTGFCSSQLGQLTYPKPRPIWERHLLNQLSVNHLRSNSVSHPEFNRVPDLCRFLSRFSHDRITPTSTTFDKGSINELKRLALSTSPLNRITYTSFEVLSAHIWRNWAKALNFPSNQILKLLFSINARNRVKPGLPSGYYGNAFVLGCAQTTVKDLTELGLSYSAGLIKRAKERVDNDYVKSVIDSVSESRACPDSVGVLILSEWSRLGLDCVDFGMGKPIQVGPVCCDRYCLFLPVFNQAEAVKVTVAVPTSAVDKYEYLVRSLCT